jgi:hypothetical protein
VACEESGCMVKTEKVLSQKSEFNNQQTSCDVGVVIELVHSLSHARHARP